MAGYREIERTTESYEILEMVLAGASPQDIANQRGVATSTVNAAIRRQLVELQDRTAELAGAYREILYMRLERLWLAIYEEAAGGNLQAIDRGMKIIDMEAKLIGAYAPRKVDQRSVNIIASAKLSDEELRKAYAALGVDEPPKMSDIKQRDVQAELAKRIDRVKIVDG